MNDGSKNRIQLPPAYRQFSDDGVGKQIGSENQEMDRITGENAADNLSTKGDKKSSKSKKTKKEKSKNKPRKGRSLLNNYFMSRRRFYKMMETKMDR